MLTGDNGILLKSTTAKEETIKAQYEEELNLLIINMRTDTISKNVEFNMEYVIKKLPEYLDKEQKNDYEWDIEQVTDEPVGEYKGYIFYIDKDYVAHIEAEASGIKPDIESELITEGYVLEGDIVEIKIRATIEEGNVEIIAPEGILVTKVKETEKEKIYVYSVDRNDIYLFTAKGDSGRRNKENVEVNRIISKPKINITNNAGGEVTINVENNYPEDADIKYTYYLGTIEKDSSESNCTIDNLLGETTYKAKVVITCNGKSLESDEITVETTRILTSPIMKLTGGSGKVALDYPLLTKDGVMTCYYSPLAGDNVILEIESIGANVTNYYSCDNGENWIEYENNVEIKFPGSGILLAKSVNDEGLASLKVSTFEVEKQYCYDVNYQAKAIDALGYGAYDGNIDSYACNVPYFVGNAAHGGDNLKKRYLEIDTSAIGKQVSITWGKPSSLIRFELTVRNQTKSIVFFRRELTEKETDNITTNITITNEMKWIMFELTYGEYNSHGRIHEVNIK